MNDRTELTKHLREHADSLKRLAALHRELGGFGSTWIAKGLDIGVADLTTAADLIEREAAVPERVRMPEPMTDEEIIMIALLKSLTPKTIQDVPRIKAFARAIEAEVMRRVREVNK